jgi:hypothetical protein
MKKIVNKGASPLILVYIWASTVTLLAMCTDHYIQAGIGGLVMVFISMCEWYDSYKEEQARLEQLTNRFKEFNR